MTMTPAKPTTKKITASDVAGRLGVSKWTVSRAFTVGASIAPDVTPELALDAIESVVVLGALHGSPAVKAALAGRIR